MKSGRIPRRNHDTTASPLPTKAPPKKAPRRDGYRKHRVERTRFDDASVAILRDNRAAIVASGGDMADGSTLLDERTIALLERAPVVGRGAFASVFDTGGGLCMKVERTSHFRAMRSLLCAIAIGISAGAMDIGPRVVRWAIAKSELADHPVIVSEMTLIEGATLGAWASNPDRTRGDLARMAESLTDLMERAARVGIIHNDLNYANVVVDASSDRPHLIDFSFSRIDGGFAMANGAETLIDDMWRCFELTGPLHVRRMHRRAHAIDLV